VFRPTAADAAGSVHLADWPIADQALVDDDLDHQVRLARRLVELGRAARAEAKVRNRQPLRRALVGSSSWAALSPELRTDVATELNVGSIEPLASAGGELVEHSVKANFRALGKRFGKRTPAVAAAIAAADPAALAADLAVGRAGVEVDGQTVELTPDDVIVSERPRQGWSVVNEHGETVALDLELTAELARAGLAREAIRMVQEARKASGFHVSDRIELWWRADGELREALTEHEASLADELLATAVTEGEPDDESLEARSDPQLGLTYWLRRQPPSRE
jgi:isoleucyl-tRNA synthetase